MNIDEVMAALDAIPDPALRAAVTHSVPGDPVRVERLDLPGAEYWLIPFADDEGLRAVVEVRSGRAVKGGVVTAPGAGFLLAPGAALDAVRATGAAPGPSQRLVWQPCAESWDSFQPLWLVDTAGGPVFVDQAGTVHEELHTDLKGA